MTESQSAESGIGGPLQAKVAMMLRDESLCGVDMMRRLKLTPGTIYPVLEELGEKGLVDYRVEKTGGTRRKMFSLTKKGARRLRVYLVSSARAFAFDATVCLGRIMKDLEGLVEIEPRQEVLCTVRYDDLETYLSLANVTYSYDLSNVRQNSYDVALSFLGVGYLMGRKSSDIADYIALLHGSLKKGGRLVAVEIEKSDSILARIVFEDIVGLKEQPGLREGEVETALAQAGFRDTRVIAKSGFLYAFSEKM